jgi:hypothetical protein
MINEELSTDREKKLRNDLLSLFKASPLSGEWLLSNLNLYTRRQDLSRVLFLNEIYQKIVPVQGVIMEFGVHWGHNMALYENFRGIYEPFNHSRKIVGFDTFEGFPSVDEKDGKSEVIKKGTFSTTKKYEDYLSKVLDYHESESPISHIKKYQLVKGDASYTIKLYLKDHPETIIALAYFDFDIYKPTKDCLEAIKPHLVKGSVIVFDQLNVSDYPGETRALKEVFNLNEIKLRRLPITSIQSYFVVGD